MAKRVLLIGGSLNQTTMMHQIAAHLTDCECWFSRFYADMPLEQFARLGLLDFTILGGRHRTATEEHFRLHQLPLDHGGKQREYDLVIIGTDLVLPHNVRTRRLVLVQEGMLDAEGPAYWAVRWLGLPRFLANTAATGLSHSYDVLCAASPGYRDEFIRKGVTPEKIRVTGIPNFDNVEAFRENDFPHRGHVLAATSNARETFKRDDRAGFIRRVTEIASGRKIIFRLHPNEHVDRAVAEIRSLAPQALVFSDGNTNHMIANCDVLVTQYSSVTFVGLALAKQVHSYLDVERLRRLTPIQNGGTSAANIASVCRELLARPVGERASGLRFRRVSQGA